MYFIYYSKSAIIYPKVSSEPSDLVFTENTVYYIIFTVNNQNRI